MKMIGSLIRFLIHILSYHKSKFVKKHLISFFRIKFNHLFSVPPPKSDQWLS